MPVIMDSIQTTMMIMMIGQMYPARLNKARIKTIRITRIIKSEAFIMIIYIILENFYMFYKYLFGVIGYSRQFHIVGRWGHIFPLAVRVGNICVRVRRGDNYTVVEDENNNKVCVQVCVQV